MGGSNGMFDPGNVNVAQPYFIAGRTGAQAATAGQPVARLAQLGLIEPKFGNVLQLTPIRISQIRLKLFPTASPAAGAVFEIVRGIGTPATTGGNARTAQRRKTTGYPPITLAETHLYVGDTGAISGGAFTPLEAGVAVDTVGVGFADPGAGAAVWAPSDLCGHVLEAGEAMEVRVVTTSGTPIVAIAFDFLR